MNRLNRPFSDIEPIVRRFCIISWITGSVFLILGELGDATGFWQGKSFLTNLVSSITGAAFGIPVALIFLERLAARQAERAEARSAARLAYRVAGEILRTATGLAPDGLKRLTDTIKTLSKIQLDIHEIFDDRKQERADSIRQEFGDLLENWKHISAIPSGSAKERLSEIEQQWSYFKREVYARIAETGGSWVEYSIQEEVEQILQSLTRYNNSTEPGDIYIIDEIHFHMSEYLDDIKNTHRENIKEVLIRAHMLEKLLVEIIQLNKSIKAIQAHWE